MSEELTIKKKIDLILKQMESGVIGESTQDRHATQAEIDRLAHLCSNLETPLDLLNTRRYRMVGEMLYTSTRDGIDITGYPRKSLPVLRLDTTKLLELLYLLKGD